MGINLNHKQHKDHVLNLEDEQGRCNWVVKLCNFLEPPSGKGPHKNYFITYYFGLFVFK